MQAFIIIGTIIKGPGSNFVILLYGSGKSFYKDSLINSTAFHVFLVCFFFFVFFLIDKYCKGLSNFLRYQKRLKMYFALDLFYYTR